MLNPSLTTYNELQTLHAGTLKCACSVTAIPYESFTLLSALSHQVCSSDFVSDRWLSILNVAIVISTHKDWRNRAYSEFKLLSDLCQLANKTIEDFISGFLLRSYIASNMITEDDFNVQFNATFDDFVKSILVYFNTLIETVKLTIQVDQPFMAVTTDVFTKFDTDLTLEIYLDLTIGQILSKVCFN